MYVRNPDDPVYNLAPILPGLLTISTEDRGRGPMRLDDYFPFEDTFSTLQPPKIVHRSSRQIGKTVQIAARLILECAMRPGTRVVVVTPLQEQSDLLSNQIFKPLIESSPVRILLSDRGALGNVRIKPFINDSMLQFSYALGDTLRLRSKTGRILYADEAQHLDSQDLPAIEQTLSASKTPQTWISGTSLTKDTFLETEWNYSSQGVWQIHCGACGFENICCIEPDGHLLAMIGPPRDDISEARPGLLCKGCQQPVNPRFGRWIHRFPERLPECAGYHAPQPIFPIHYSHPNKWRILHGRMGGRYSTAKFYNECLGEAYDLAYKVVSIDDLRKAATLGPNTLDEARRRCRDYRVVVAGVDWGGGGDDGVSRTKVAMCGLNNQGGVDVFFGFGFQPTTDRIAEGREVCRLASICQAHLICHDIGGGIGTASEAAFTYSGWPQERIVRMKYVGVDTGNTRPEFHEPVGERMLGYYTIHKSKTLQFLSQAIKYGLIRFFEYDYKGPDEPGHLHDFLSLVEDKVDTPTGQTYRIRRSSNTVCDDFSAAVNYGIQALWYYTQSWPELHPDVAGSVGTR